MTMTIDNRIGRHILSGLIIGVFLMTAAPAFSQVRETISATAMGTSQQLGRNASIDIRINDYSSDEEREALVSAFKEKGSRGLVNALGKLGSKGRIAITGTLGFDLNFVRAYETEDGGRLIRFVTDRPVTFVERWWSTRSSDYQITLGEIRISPDKSKSSGTLFPAAKVLLNKKNEIEIQSFRSSWKLVNIRHSIREL